MSGEKIVVRRRFAQDASLAQGQRKKTLFVLEVYLVESHNLGELATKLKERFTLFKPSAGKKETDVSNLSLLKDEKEETRIKADTLFALLSVVSNLLPLHHIKVRLYG